MKINFETKTQLRKFLVLLISNEKIITSIKYTDNSAIANIKINALTELKAILKIKPPDLSKDRQEIVNDIALTHGSIDAADKTLDLWHDIYQFRKTGFLFGVIGPIPLGSHSLYLTCIGDIEDADSCKLFSDIIERLNSSEFKKNMADIV